MPTDDGRITIFIPTLATRARAPYLRVAVQSVLAQSQVDVRIAVIANGPDCDEHVLAALGREPRVQVVRSDARGFPAALRAGREAVRTPFFGELDDDDELLPDALASRLEAMRRDSALTMVVSNGILRDEAQDVPSIPDLAAVRRDPLRSLLERNWLLPGSALFRSDAVTAESFAAIPRCLEWTYLGLLLAPRGRIDFLSEPGVVHYEHRPFSTYDSHDCRVERVPALQSLFLLELPADVRRRIRTKVGAARHDLSNLHLQEGNRRAAWREHLLSLAYPRGWRYLAHTRHLWRAPRSMLGTGEARPE